MADQPSPNICCVSLGMVIIDNIHMPNKPALYDVLGGSATFVTLGQRLFASELSEVGCLLVAGEDFPQTVKEEIQNWGTTLVLKERTNARSTRGKLEYEDDTFGRKYS